MFEAVRGITTHLAAEGSFDVEVVGIAADDDDPEALTRHWEGVEVRRVPGRGAAGFWGLWRHAITADTRGIDIVHAHGLWDGASLAGSILARRAKCPLVVTPHGMLADWAFRHRAIKKALPWLLWERRVIARADVLEAKSAKEAEAFGQRGLQIPVEVIPVGLEFPAPSQPKSKREERRTCLFLSRIHPVKGIDILLHSWANVRPRGWQLVIAGPDAEDHESAMKRLRDRLQLHDSVRFTGPRYGSEKWEALRQADLFILPSQTENFGLVIAEALAIGLPCITTTGTPWTDLPQRGLGWCVDPEISSITQAIREATSLSPEALREMGDGGPRYVSETFSWAAVIRRTVDLYTSLIKDARKRQRES